MPEISAEALAPSYHTEICFDTAFVEEATPSFRNLECPQGFRFSREIHLTEVHGEPNFKFRTQGSCIG
jgi:hypothetical protein